MIGLLYNFFCAISCTLHSDKIDITREKESIKYMKWARRKRKKLLWYHDGERERDVSAKITHIFTFLSGML